MANTNELMKDINEAIIELDNIGGDDVLAVGLVRKWVEQLGRCRSLKSKKANDLLTFLAIDLSGMANAYRDALLAVRKVYDHVEQAGIAQGSPEVIAFLDRVAS